MIPFRLRTVRVGLQSSVLVILSLGAYPFLPGGPTLPVGVYMSLLTVGLVGAVLVWRLPWARLFETRTGDVMLYVWSALDIVLITAAFVAAGGGSSSLYLVYLLTTVYFSVSYPVRAQLSLLGFTYVCFGVGLGLTGWEITPAELALRVVVLAIATFITSFVSSELLSEMAAHHSAKAESDRRANLLARVAEAARTMSSLDADRVLAGVVDAAAGLGYDAAALCVFEDDHEHYTIRYARGLPAEFASGRHPVDLGMPGLVLRDRKTVVVPDYADVDSPNPQIAATGVRAAIASPIWSRGRLVAVLAAGAGQVRDLPAPDVEAFELLAAQAGRALDNARRFEQERRTVERLGELDRMKNDFVSTVSHELRTPLTVIGGIAHTLDQRWDMLTEAQRRQLIERASSNARSLDEIISKLLDFSRMEVGKLEIVPVAVDLGAFVDGLVVRLGSVFAQHPVSVIVDDDVIVRADPALLERVVENLLVNAVRHTPPGTRVEVRAATTPTAAVVHIRDDGPGIPPEEVEHLGERFFRGGDPNTRRTRGLGLGLALVREILVLHGSALDVSSEPGRGSSFSFRLPLATPATLAQPA